MAKSDSRNAVDDMVNAFKSVFKNYSRTARRKTWEALKSKEGNKVINKIIDNPSVPTPGLPKLLSFKEWLNHSTP